MMLTPSQYDLLLPFRNQPMHFIDDALPDEYRLLEQRGFIKAGWAESGDIIEWSITPLGLAALERFEHCREKDAKQERQQRFQNKISIASVLVPLVTFFLGILVEHFAGIVAFVLSLF